MPDRLERPDRPPELRSRSAVVHTARDHLGAATDRLRIEKQAVQRRAALLKRRQARVGVQRFGLQAGPAQADICDGPTQVHAG